MKVPRRHFLQLAGAAAMSTLPRTARADTYPDHAVRLVCGFAQAGVADITSRLISQFLSERLHRQFVVENRTGAGGNIGTLAVVQSPPDGYTLLMCGVASAVNTTLYEHLEFDFLRDIVPVASIARVANVVVVHPSSPDHTLADLIARAKASPGTITMATGGNGSTPHMFGELFKLMAKVDLPAIAYRGGGPALIDLLGAHVDVIFDPIPESIGYIRGGKLRPLAVTSATRQAVLPDVPVVAEFVPGYEATGWLGLGAPKDTPADVIAILHREVGAALADQEFVARLANLGAASFASTTAEFGTLLVDETAKWGKVVRAAGLKAG